MSIRISRSSYALLPFVLALAACNSDPPAPAASNGGAASGNDERMVFDASMVPETADAAVRTVIEGLRQKHPEAIWHFLPASYQQDVNDVIHDFAQRMDPELWSKTVALLGKLARVAKAQKELLGMTVGPPPKDGVPAQPVDFEGLANLLQTLVNSDMGNLEKLKAADAGTILAVTGGQFIEQLQALSKFGPPDSASLPIDALSRLKVELKASEGDEAVVVIRAPDEAPRETEFVRVEGKWVPRNLAESWIETVGLAKARLSLLSRDNLTEQKPRWMTLIATFDAALDQLAAARNKDEFAGALQGLFLPGMMLMGMLQQPVDADDREPANDPHPAPGAKELVTILVRGKLDKAAQNALLERLKSATGRTEGLFAEFIGDEESTSFKVGPVDDIDSFASRLEFLTNVEVDAASRLITGLLRQ